MKIFCSINKKPDNTCQYTIKFECERESITKNLDPKISHNELHYLAVIHATLEAKDGDEVYTSSDLVLGQVLDNWKVNAYNLQILVINLKNLLQRKEVTLKKI